MGRIEKTVFISYRRANFAWARLIYDELHHHSYDVFYDYLGIDSGDFETVILENIRSRAHFVVLLTPSALERCAEPGDWLRREIETALDENRNIVPLMLEGFDFCSPVTIKALTGRLADLKKYNGMSVPYEYFDAAMDKLRNRFLNVAVEAVLRPVSPATRQATKEQKAAADEAPPVQEEQITAQAWFERGYALQADKKLEDALKCYQEVIRLDPAMAAAHFNQGNALDDLNRYDEAEAAYRKAIEFDPSYAAAYYNLGIVLKELKRYDETEAAYRKAIELDPSYALVYNNLGNLLEELKRPAEAEAAYRKTIELDPSLAAAYYNLGRLLHGLKRNAEAEAAYARAIELDPSDPDAYFNLGNLLSDLDRTDEAEAAYRKSIELDPALAQAHNNLGKLLYGLKRYAEAEAAYRKAIELDPLYGLSHANLALLLRTTGKASEALIVLSRLAELSPEDAGAQLELASVSRELGRAIPPDCLEKARQNVREDDYYNRACLESVAGNPDAAFALLARASEQGALDRGWAWQDPDLQWVRDDPRFAQIVGEKPAEG